MFLGKNVHLMCMKMDLLFFKLLLKSLSFTYLEINVLKIEVTMTCIGLSMVFYGLYQLWLNKIKIFHLL